MGRNPCYYVLMIVLSATLAWLVGVFVWHWGKLAWRWSIRQVLCLFGYAHRTPEVHLPDWDEKKIRVRRWGPIKDHWWSMDKYYVSIEYSVCRHQGCRKFKIIRMIR